MNKTQTRILRKVPEVTVIFWITKLLTTAMGEAVSDFFANNFNPYAIVLLAALILAAALTVQLKVKKYIPAVYWFSVAMVAVFGTMAADVLHKQFGVAYEFSTAFFLVVLAAVFGVWYKIEGTLSIHSISSRRRELFYWLTVMTTFALGTAAGDWTAYSLRLGYFTSALVFGALMVIPIAGYAFKRSGVVVFWLAYVLTRPLGASFADWFGKPVAATGLNLGDGTVGSVLAVLIVGCVVYMMLNKREQRAETAA